ADGIADDRDRAVPSRLRVTAPGIQRSPDCGNAVFQPIRYESGGIVGPALAVLTDMHAIVECRIAVPAELRRKNIESRRPTQSRYAPNRRSARSVRTSTRNRTPLSGSNQRLPDRLPQHIGNGSH